MATVSRRRVQNVRFDMGEESHVLAELLWQVAARPRPGGITLAEMDVWLPVMRTLREQEQEPALILDEEVWSLLCREIRQFPFSRPDAGLRGAIQALFDATQSEVEVTYAAR